MKLHLIRHGTTTTSGKTFAGRSDVALNEEGRAMAQRIARDLATARIGLVFSSPLSRAINTATPLASEQGVPIRSDPDLMEFDFGKYEGMAKEDLGIVLRKAHALTPVPGGEALVDVWRRAEAFLSRLRSSVPPLSGDVVVMGHFWINRMIYGHLTCLDFEATCRSRDYRPATGSIVTLDFLRPEQPVEESARSRDFHTGLPGDG